MIKIEATFPKRDNEGMLFKAEDFQRVDDFILNTVGGFSLTESKGAWKDDSDNGKVYYDSSYVYSVVCADDDAQAIMADLKNIILVNFRQLSAWITYTPIHIF